MSNLTRLTKNNEDLEALKLDIGNLPDYQDIKPIYGKSAGINTANISTLGSSSNTLYSICQINDYIIYGTEKGAEISKLTSSGYEYIGLVVNRQQNYSVNVYGLGSNTEYLFFYYDDYVTKKIYAFKLSDKICSELSTNMPSFVGIGNNLIITKSAITEIIIPETGTNITFNSVEHTTSTSSGDGLYYLSNDLYYSYREEERDWYNHYELFWYNSTSSHKQISLSSGTTLNSKIIGMNRSHTKFFCTDGIFSANADFTLGEKLNDFVVNNVTTPLQFRDFTGASGNYYYYNFLINLQNSDYYMTYGKIKSGFIYILKFNEETNEFECIIENSGGTNPYGYGRINSILAVPLYYDNSIYILNGDKQEIGFIKNGINFYYDSLKPVLNNTKILTGYSTYDLYGNTIQGTMPNNGALNITPSTSSQTIPAGYTSGGSVSAVTSSIDSNIQSKNIKSGITILGVSGNSNVIDTTTESVIPNYTSVTNFELDSETNYYIFNGSLKNGILKIEFTNNLVQNIVLNYKGSGFAGDGILSFQMDNENPIDIAEDKSIYTDYVFSNVLPGSHTITIDVPNMIGTTYLEIKMIPIIETGITSNTVLNGNIGFVNGTKITGSYVPVDTSDATATASEICAGKTAYVNGVKLTGTGPMTFATETEMNQVTNVPENTLAIVYGTNYVGTYRFDNGSWTQIGDASVEQEVMDNLNTVMGSSDEYEGLGGTEEEINEVFDEILGNEGE